MAVKIVKSDDQWKQQLSEMAFDVARKQGTEPAFSGTYYNNNEIGYYTCICCDSRLFSSNEKYDSGSGWLSFWQPAHTDSLIEHTDISHGMKRVEVCCAACDAHLGHVFEDGPQPTGLRYCINSICLDFKKA